MLTDRGFSHALANIILEKDPTNEAALKMLEQPKNRAVIDGVTYDLDEVSEEDATRVWLEGELDKYTPQEEE
jgi:hypothetical protein